MLCLCNRNPDHFGKTIFSAEHFGNLAFGIAKWIKSWSSFSPQRPTNRGDVHLGFIGFSQGGPKECTRIIKGKYCWWPRSCRKVEVGSFSHYLQGFIHPRSQVVQDSLRLFSMSSITFLLTIAYFKHPSCWHFFKWSQKKNIDISTSTLHQSVQNVSWVFPQHSAKKKEIHLSKKNNMG